MNRSADFSRPMFHKARHAHAKSLVAGTHAALVLALTILVMLATASPALSGDIEVKPMGNWLEHREAIYQGKPLLIHLRTGYERATLFPEPIRLTEPDQTLPDCDLVIDEELLGFYPKRSFKRQALKLTGLETGTEYVLLVEASPYGLRQPLQINR